jgi:hypothetical protein
MGPGYVLKLSKNHGIAKNLPVTEARVNDEHRFEICRILEDF